MFTNHTDNAGLTLLTIRATDDVMDLITTQEMVLQLLYIVVC